MVTVNPCERLGHYSTVCSLQAHYPSEWGTMERLREEQGLPSRQRPHELEEEEHRLFLKLEADDRRRAAAEVNGRAAVERVAAEELKRAQRKVREQQATVAPYMTRSDAVARHHLPRAFGVR
jgi:hypothetical protein